MSKSTENPFKNPKILNEMYQMYTGFKGVINVLAFVGFVFIAFLVIAILIGAKKPVIQENQPYQLLTPSPLKD